jgi:hypothetical protein
MSKLKEKPSALKPSKENIQHFKKLNLLTLSNLWAIFTNPDVIRIRNTVRNLPI